MSQNNISSNQIIHISGNHRKYFLNMLFRLSNPIEVRSICPEQMRKLSVSDLLCIILFLILEKSKF